MDPKLPARPDFLPPGFGTVGHQEFVEIMPPAIVAYAPQTPAWTVLAIVLLLAAAYGCWRAVRRYRKNAYRRAALSELKRLRQSLPNERENSLRSLPILLKRCALARFPREQVAPLSGEAWLSFLESTAPSSFDSESQQALQTLVQKGAQALNHKADLLLFDASQRWIKRHHA